MATSVVQKIANAGGVGIPVSLTTSTGATTTEGILLGTTETATVGAQKFSPSLHFQGSGWKTNATAGAQSCDWVSEIQPVQGAAAPTNNLHFLYSIGGAAYASAGYWGNGIAMTFGQDGIVADSLHSTSGIITAGSATQTAFMIEFASQNIILGNSSATFCWSSSATSDPTTLRNGKDTGLSRVSAGVVGVGTGAAGSTAGGIIASSITGNAIVSSGASAYMAVQSAQSAQWTMLQVTEQTTIAAAATTDTTLDLPAGAIIEAIGVKVTVAIPTATSFSIGDPTTAARFGTGISTALNTTATCIDHWSGAVSTAAAGPTQPSAAKVRFTMAGGTPATNAGRVRITVFYRIFTAPQS